MKFTVNFKNRGDGFRALSRQEDVIHGLLQYTVLPHALHIMGHVDEVKWVKLMKYTSRAKSFMSIIGYNVCGAHERSGRWADISST